VAAPFLIRTADPADASGLERLQRSASSTLPEYREQLAAHPGAIEIPADPLRDGLVRAAEEGGVVVGFCVLLPAVDGACELDGLFVEPGRMGEGIGSLLTEDAVRIARGRGAVRIEVVAAPAAVGFYERVGFAAGEEVSTRFGPAVRMRLPLPPAAGV